MLCANEAHQRTFMEKYSSGRRGAPAKGVGRVTGAEVQIFSSPPNKMDRIFPVLFILFGGEGFELHPCRLLGAEGTFPSAFSEG